MATQQELHVIFGTGPLAKVVMRELLKRNVQIRMVNRSGHATVPQQVEIVAGNAYDSENVPTLTRGARVVYQWGAKERKGCCITIPYTLIVSLR